MIWDFALLVSRVGLFNEEIWFCCLSNFCSKCELLEWQITPLITFTMVLLALSPCLIKAWRDPQPGMVTRWVAYAYTCGFFFGWHVHEKASLHFVIPLATVAVENVENARHYFLLSIGIVLSLQATRGWDASSNWPKRAMNALTSLVVILPARFPLLLQELVRRLLFF